MLRHVYPLAPLSGPVPPGAIALKGSDALVVADLERDPSLTTELWALQPKTLMHDFARRPDLDIMIEDLSVEFFADVPSGRTLPRRASVLVDRRGVDMYCEVEDVEYFGNHGQMGACYYHTVAAVVRAAPAAGAAAHVAPTEAS